MWSSQGKTVSFFQRPELTTEREKEGVELGDLGGEDNLEEMRWEEK